MSSVACLLRWEHLPAQQTRQQAASPALLSLTGSGSNHEGISEKFLTHFADQHVGLFEVSFNYKREEM